MNEWRKTRIACFFPSCELKDKESRRNHFSLQRSSVTIILIEWCVFPSSSSFFVVLFVWMATQPKKILQHILHFKLTERDNFCTVVFQFNDWPPELAPQDEARTKPHCPLKSPMIDQNGTKLQDWLIIWFWNELILSSWSPSPFCWSVLSCLKHWLEPVFALLHHH